MEIPPKIIQRLRDSEAAAHQILKEAHNAITEFPTSAISLQVSSSGPTRALSANDHARSLTFVIRYEHLPEIHDFVPGKAKNGRYYLNETDAIRAALNEYRTIFYNQDDGIFYLSISKLYRSFLESGLPNASMKIQAITECGEDRSNEYSAHLKSRQNAIMRAVKKSDFDYIYNGVLQHSDNRFGLKMVKDYTDGSLSYILLKNVLIAQGLKELFREHYRVVNTLSFPKMGSL